MLLDGFKRLRCAQKLHLSTVPFVSLAPEEAAGIVCLLRAANDHALSLLEQARFSAEGEFQASERLKDAAAIMSQESITVELRYVQTLLEIGAANNSTIVFPIPIDLLTALSKAADSESS